MRAAAPPVQVVWMTDTSAEAVAARAAEQLTSATAAMVTQGNIELERAEAEKRAKKEAKRKVSSLGAAVCLLLLRVFVSECE